MPHRDLQKGCPLLVSGIQNTYWAEMGCALSMINTGEWAEVCFVPNAECHTKKGQPYLALRERLKQPTLPAVEQTITQYKLFGVVTNMD
jgi:hypothetical protein